MIRQSTRLSAMALGAALIVLAPLGSSSATGDKAAELADIIVIDQPVVDRAGVVPAEGMAQLDQALRSLRSDTRVHMAALLIRTTGGEPIEDYAHRQAQAWGGGEAGVDQGVLLVIAIDDRRMRLEVGYGLEGTLTDALSRRILAMAKPHLRSSDYADAVAAIIDGVSAVVQGIALPDGHAAGAAMRARQMRFVAILWLLGSALGMGLYFGLRRRGGRRRGKKNWRRRAMVWGGTVALSLLVAVFAPDGAILWASLGMLGMMPFGYILARAPRGGSKFGAVFVVLWFLTIATLGYLLLSGETTALPGWFYALSPVGLGFAGFVSSAVLMALSVVILIILLPLSVIEVKLRRTELRKSRFLDFWYWLSHAVLRALAGDPKAEFSSGGGASYSSSYSSSSSSYSSSSSGSSSWSGGGGSFGGGGASSSW